MEVLNPNGQKIYNITAKKLLPEFLTEKKKRLLKKDKEFRNRIELLQDFTFPTYCNRLKYTRDGQYLISTGGYSPRIKVYELAELGLKFERRVDDDIVEFQVLSDDYSKLACLRADRSIEFHARNGPYFKTRIPKPGRDLMYDYASCDLLMCGAGPEIHRLNLDRGSFLKPITSSCPSLNCCGINPVHALYAFGGEDGVVEFYDPRTFKTVAYLSIAAQVEKDFDEKQCEVSALRYRSDGVGIAVGTSTGQALLYDLRMSAPVHSKDHQFGTPIMDIKFHESSRNLITSCRKIVRIWNVDDGKLFTAIEPNVDINDVCIQDGYVVGVMFIAAEAERVNAYYIPGLGPCPPWCAYLDNLTEQFEEVQETAIYSDYKFVTKDDLERLSVANLIGTPYLRAYMHGFFMDKRLYDKVRALANPDEWKELRREKIRQKLDEKRQSRISIPQKLPAVNKDAALRAMQASVGKRAGEAADLLTGRFAAMFNNPAFAIDSTSDAFRAVNPLGKKSALPNTPIDTQFSEIESGEKDDDVSDDNMSVDKSANESADESGSESGQDVMPDKSPRPPAASHNTESSRSSQGQPNVGQKRKLRFFEMKDNEINPLQSDAALEASKKRRLESTSFAQRIATSVHEDVRPSAVGTSALTMTFLPNDVKEKKARVATEMRERKEFDKSRRRMSDRMLGVKRKPGAAMRGRRK